MTELSLNQIDRKTRELNMANSHLFDNFTDRAMGAGTLGNVLPVSTDTATNVIRTPLSTLYSTNIAAQTLLCPTTCATGLSIAGDQTASDGFEITLQEPGQTDSRFTYTIGSEPVGFFIEAKFTVADVTGAAELLIGFHELATVEADRTTYTDYALFGPISDTTAKIKIATDLADAGETLTDTTDVVSDTVNFILRVEVTTDGKVTYKMANTAALVTAGTLSLPTVGLDYTFDDATVIVPCIRIIQHSDLTGTAVMNYLHVGYMN